MKLLSPHSLSLNVRPALYPARAARVHPTTRRGTRGARRQLPAQLAAPFARSRSRHQPNLRLVEVDEQLRRVRTQGRVRHAPLETVRAQHVERERRRWRRRAVDTDYAPRRFGRAGRLGLHRCGRVGRRGRWILPSAACRRSLAAAIGAGPLPPLLPGCAERASTRHVEPPLRAGTTPTTFARCAVAAARPSAQRSL